jgi:ATP-binding cassette, subfamily B, bacterial PglK
LEIFKKLFSLFEESEKNLFYIIIFLTFIMGLIQVLGILSILPFMTFLMDSSSEIKNPYLQKVYNYFAFEDTNDFLLLLGSISLFLFIFSTVFKALTSYCIYRFAYMMDYSISKKLVIGYLNQPYKFFLNNNTTVLVKTVLSETTEVVGKGIMPMIELIGQLIISIIIILLIVYINPNVAFYITITVCLSYFLIYFVIRNSIKNNAEGRFNANTHRFKILNETFVGIKQVKIFGLEQSLSSKFNYYSKSMAIHLSMIMLLKQIPKYVIEISAFGGLLFIILISLNLGRDINKLIPELAVFAFAGYRIMPSLQMIFNSVSDLKYIDKPLNSLLLNFQKVRNFVPSKVSRNSIFKLNKSIKLEDALFSYNKKGKNILNNLNIEIKANTTIAIIGKTGSGKTTLIDVIIGLLKLNSGNIHFDDISVKEIDIKKIQSQLAYVPQDIILNDDTIASNIAFGEDETEINKKKLHAASKMAEIYDFIINETLDGFNTHVGDRGIRLSGGQKQRIGLARALYKEPKLLILDETTSALDGITEDNIMRTINEIKGEMTIILIAHRLSTIRKADLIYILNEGKVIESGTYQNLSKNSKYFKQLEQSDLKK